MPSYHDAVRAEIMARVKTLATGLDGALSLKCQYDNLPFLQPKASPWGRIELVVGKTAPAAIGHRLNRTPLILYLQVFIPEAAGTRIAWQAADMMAEVFDYQTLSLGHAADIGFQTASPPVSAGVKDGFRQFNVTIDGSYDTEPSFVEPG